MPNIETESKNNVPSSRKKDKKPLAVATDKDVSSLPQETLSPTTPALESGLENVNKNPYVDVVNKRIKKLNKVMLKIDKYESIKNSSDPSKVQLNPDQVKVLERKGEISGAIKEFEETLKQIEAVEKEELKKQAEQKKAQQEERDQAIADAVEEAKAEYCKSLLQLILFFRLVHFQQRGIIQLPDNEFEAVETLRAKLTNLSEEAENDELYEEKIRQVLDLVNKLHLGDEGLITKSLPNGLETDVPSLEPPSSYGISYSQLRSLIQNPPILVESSGDQEELNETFEIINTEHIEVSNEYSGDLRFMRPDDQSHQHQAFDATINNTTYVYQNTETPAVVTETIVDVNIQEQYNQQQSYETYTVEQQQFVVEQQYIGEQQQQHYIEQENQQQIPTEQEVLPQRQEEPLSVQEPQTTSENQADLKLPQATQQDNNNQPPPLSQGSGNRGRYNRGRGRGQARRDSSGYNNYGGGNYRDGNYGNYRGRGGSRGRGGGFQGNNRGAPHKQRSQ